MKDRNIKKQPKKKKCSHKNIIPELEYDCYPYGANCKWDKCLDCGKKLNFKVF